MCYCYIIYHNEWRIAFIFHIRSVRVSGIKSRSRGALHITNSWRGAILAERLHWITWKVPVDLVWTIQFIVFMHIVLLIYNTAGWHDYYTVIILLQYMCKMERSLDRWHFKLYIFMVLAFKYFRYEVTLSHYLAPVIFITKLITPRFVAIKSNINIIQYYVYI